MAASTTKLGPGTLTIGETGSEVDFSCQVIGARIAWDVTADDDVPTMCGDVVAGDRTYTAALSGSLFQDLADPDGIVYYSWDHKGEAVPFTFTPSTAIGAVATGTITLDPLDVGGDDASAKLTADFEWACVGEPVLTAPVPPPLNGTRSTGTAADRGELVGA
jgi:hypothetical protein